MTTFWIAHINIGGRRLVLILILLSLLVFTPLRDIVVGIILLILILTAIAIYSYGVYVRRYRFWEHGERYDVKDYFNLRDHSQNARILARSNTNTIDSKIFPTRQKKWAYLSGFQDILKKHLIKYNSSILILGSGVGALAKTMIHSYPGSHIDAVDVSPMMISVGKKYFLTDSEQKRITFFCEDAESYLRRPNKKYNVILVDLFVNSHLVDSVTKESFIHNLASHATHKTIILINFHYEKPTNITEASQQYERVFPKYFLITNSGRLIGIANS